MKKITASALLNLMLAVFLSTSVAVSAQAISPAMGAPDRVQLERRLESVKTLLEKSSAAKQIESSNDPAAIAGKVRALELWQQAKQAFDKGDLALTQKLLVEAPKAMFSAARQAAPEQLLSDKIKADYNNRRDSVKALLSAQKRIADEKGNVADAAQASKTIEEMLAEADKFAADGRFEQARVLVDKAYLVAKASVGSMRSGDTLVRSLNFATKEDEYIYELDRNDTHLMLIKVLVEQKSGRTPAVDVLVGKAAALRQQAETEATKKDFQEAIKLLESSTGELVRAIRGAGIYIPG